MSADLLRRAATELRRSVEGVPSFFAPPWHPVLTDSESLTGVRSCSDHFNTAAGPTAEWACDNCEHIETYSEGLASYIAALHPPVALALADLLDAMVGFKDSTGLQLPEGPGTLMAVARAVLREPEEAS